VSRACPFIIIIIVIVIVIIVITSLGSPDPLDAFRIRLQQGRR
jgi:hypothetical protein